MFLSCTYLRMLAVDAKHPDYFHQIVLAKILEIIFSYFSFFLFFLDLCDALLFVISTENDFLASSSSLAAALLLLRLPLLAPFRTPSGLRILLAQ